MLIHEICLVAQGLLCRATVHEGLIELLQCVVAHRLALQFSDQGFLFLLVQLDDSVVDLLMEQVLLAGTATTQIGLSIILTNHFTSHVLICHERVLLFIFLQQGTVFFVT